MTTSVREWRDRNAPVEVELPSGNSALLRRVHIVDLAMAGEIPAPLVAEASKLMEKGVDALDERALQRWMGVLNAVAKAAFVRPPVRDEGTDEALGVAEVGTIDKLAVFQWCQGGEAQRWEPFRQEPAAAVESAPAGE